MGGRMTVGGRTASNLVRLIQRCSWLQQLDHLRYITMQISIGFSFFLLICFVSLFDGVMESHCCLCKCYNAYVYIETPTQNNFFYFSFDATYYYIAFHTLVAPNITFNNFHWCCMLQSSSCVLRLLYPSYYAFYRYSGCPAKIGNFNAEKIDVSHIAPK